MNLKNCELQDHCPKKYFWDEMWKVIYGNLPLKQRKSLARYFDKTIDMNECRCNDENAKNLFILKTKKFN